MEKIYTRPNSMNPRATGYCPGCLHGVATRLICELIDEFGIQERTTSVLPIGCSSMGVFHFDTDLVVSLHGRAPAVATGIKRCAPERFVYSYQGDGDLAAIGLSEIMHAANRGENITSIFVNNSIYGMTGRTGGAYDADRPESNDRAGWQKTGAGRLSYEDVRDPLPVGSACLYREMRAGHAGAHQGSKRALAKDSRTSWRTKVSPLLN